MKAIREGRLTRRRFIGAASTAIAVAGVGGALGEVERTASLVGTASPAAAASPKETLVPSLCQMCAIRCGILAHVVDGKVTRITGNPDDPLSQGRLCARGQAGMGMLYDPDRVRQPMRRDASGKFVPVSWEQAFQEIGKKLNEIKEKHGPESLVWLTHPEQLAGWEQRFMDAFGSPNWTGHAPTCYSSRVVGFATTYGLVPAADYANTRYYVSFGRSIIDGISNPQVQALMAARMAGARIVVIDPRLSDFASIADEWLAIRPGTDLALALAMIHVILRDKLYDASALAEQTVGLDQLEQGVAQYTPQWAQGITGVDAKTIERLAKGLAAAAPAAVIEPGWHGPQGGMYWNSVGLSRATACLNALLGNLGKKGGLTVPPASPLSPAKIFKPAPAASKLSRWDGAGGSEWPLAKGLGRCQEIPKVIASGEPYPIHAVIACHTNPVRAYPDGDRLVAAFKKLDLVVVIDHQMSDTAWNTAHYVLPESTYLERFGTVESRGNKLALAQPAVPPLYDTLGEDEIIRRLAAACGFPQYFSFTIEDYNNALLEPLGLTQADLRAGEREFKPSPPKPAFPLPTASKKVELASSALAKAGGPAVPVWEPPLVAPGPGQFRLIQGHVSVHTHTTTQNNSYLHALMPENRLWIHPDRAKALGVRDGDLVEVKSEVASQRVKARVTQEIVPEAVFLAHGFGCVSPTQRLNYGKGASDAALVPIRSAPFSGAAAQCETIVTVQKAR